jgi:hypothetical protein
MKKHNTIIIGLLALWFSPLKAQHIPDPPAGYTTLLSDDFNGTELDDTYWTKGLFGVNGAQLFPNPNTGGTNKLNNNYAGYLLDANVIVSEGNLELHNIKENHSGGDPEGLFNFTNGWIQSLGKVIFNGSDKSIIIRMRMKLPTPAQDDVWPAVWLVEQDQWPNEIDIWEYFGSPFNNNPEWDADDRMVLRYIWGENFNKRGSVKDEERWFDRDNNVDEFQIYEFEWDDQVMISRIGDKEIGRITRGVEVPDQDWPDSVEEWSIVINNGRMQSTVNAFGLDYSKSNVFVVDWIDIYEKDTSTGLLNQDVNNSEWLKIYPNPVKDVLNIQSYDKVERIQVYDTMGKLILTSRNESIIDLKSLNTGIYLLKVQATGKNFVQQIIKW